MICVLGERSRDGVAASRRSYFAKCQRLCTLSVVRLECSASCNGGGGRHVICPLACYFRVLKHYTPDVSPRDPNDHQKSETNKRDRWLHLRSQKRVPATMHLESRKLSAPSSMKSRAEAPLQRLVTTPRPRCRICSCGDTDRFRCHWLHATRTPSAKSGQWVMKVRDLRRCGSRPSA